MNTENIIKAINNLHERLTKRRNGNVIFTGSAKCDGREVELYLYSKKDTKKIETLEFYEFTDEPTGGKMPCFRGSLASTNFTAEELAYIITKTL